jgi:probable phosphoglycerate mutase
VITAPKTPPRIYLIRHGQTEWSISGQHTGRTDVALTVRGEDEARELRPWLAKIAFANVLCSPLQRARRTCELAGLGGQAEIEPDLAEWDYGDYEGRRSPDIRKERPGWNAFRDGCPGGEMPEQIAARAGRLMERLNAMQGNVALFSHGEFSLALAARWIGLPVIEGQHFLLATASLSILGYNPAHSETPVIALWNASPALLTNGV